MGDKLPISIVIITSGGNPREPLWNSQLLLSGRVSHVLRVSPQSVVFSETSQGPNSLTEVYCPWGDRNQARQLGLEQSSTEFIYHLDDDVAPANLQTLTRALKEFEDPAVAAVAGPYSTPKSVKLAGRFYNLLSNMWVRAGDQNRQLFLAGHVLCRKSTFVWPQEMTSGGEEDFISKQLYQSGQKIVYRPDFAADHFSDHSWVSLFRRLQGHEKAKPKSATSKLRKLNLLFRSFRS